jgi:hypothetical protein
MTLCNETELILMTNKYLDFGVFGHINECIHHLRNSRLFLLIGHLLDDEKFAADRQRTHNTYICITELDKHIRKILLTQKH